MGALFLRDTVETGVAIGSFDERKLGATVGAAAVTQNVATTASGNHIPINNAAGTADLIWLYRVNAVTISGDMVTNIWGREDVMATNAQLAVIISRYDGSGTFVSDVVAQAHANHADGVELGTADAIMNWTILTPTSTTFSAGDWLAVVVHADASGTMAAGTVTITYDGPTPAALGYSYINFTETITEYVAAAKPPRSTPYPQILAH